MRGSSARGPSSRGPAAAALRAGAAPGLHDLYACNLAHLEADVVPAGELYDEPARPRIFLPPAGARLVPRHDGPLVDGPPAGGNPDAVADGHPVPP